MSADMPAAAPRVSVILPAYNRETLVARAIDSVLAQTFTDFELIIVDDASKDGTRAVLETYRDHPKVRLILSDVNRGGSGARNLGIEAARGALIAFQDSDDVWLPHKLAAQVAALDATPRAGLCYCASLFYGEGRSYYIPEPVFERFEGDMSAEILRRNTTSTQVLLVRRDVLERSGPFDASLKRFQDWDLMIRIAQVTEFVFLPEPMAIIFATPGNISSFVANDAISRAAILTKYEHLFINNPAHAARNHYITARVWQKLGEQAKARPHLQAAMRLKPGLKTALQQIRSRLP
ncbi:glycosyltransferase family 2 protein [Neotabrizicola sp. sgz301269]|uniref:glycosyltransferase family 2 protein n=1 Tax=Neotabrizicola sp. sgz301269 TaxID=3276282 RepID=UPI00376F8DC6